ncbi:MAG: hypothetical protein HY248_01050 [Fimbriimonas ginsengisoli]|nr:hypothetical protein [Fimbriimonas ginsengisoli]
MKLVLQVHYHKSGKPEVDRTQIGLYLARKPPEKQIGLMWLMKPGLKIPAGEQAFETEIDRRIGRDVTVYGAMPHMHLLGRMMQAEAGLPDGKRVPLIKVEDWDFRWQMAYGFRKPLRLPAGTHIRVSARYDNSASNPRNPNHPPKDVAWGEQTTDEMFLMIVPYTLDGPGEPPSFRMP